MNNVELGAIGEQKACDFLKKQGYKILDRNVRFNRQSEIDIIAMKSKTVVFVEVKTRNDDTCGNPLEAITKSKYNNVKKGAMMYLEQSELEYDKFRIDAVSVVLEPKLVINHLENI